MSGNYAGYQIVTKEHARRPIRNKYSEEKHNEKKNSRVKKKNQ